jgi:hypothetical protein
VIDENAVSLEVEVVPMAYTSNKTPGTDHMWSCWEDPSGAGFRLRQSIEKSNAAVLAKINKLNLRVYYLLGGIAAIVVLLSYLHFRIGNFEDVTAVRESSAAKFRDQETKKEVKKSEFVIGSAQAAPK